MKELIPAGEFRSLAKRKLHEETVRKFGYTVGSYSGQTVQIAPYYDAEGQLVAQKLRFPNKDFVVLGDIKTLPLFGARLWGSGGKRLVITEGEIDAMSYAQASGLSWPVVSIPNGAPGAKKAIKANLEWIESFDQVVFMFDMDKPGREAAQECATMLTPGKAAIAELPGGFKDANDMLVAGKVKELMQSVWNAKTVRPDGIILGTEITLDDLKSGASKGYDLPYPELNAMIRGVRKGELTLLTAGTGTGKSTLAREIGYHLMMNHGLKIGNIYLEEQFKKTAQGYIAIHNNIPLGKLRADPALLPDDVYRKGLDEVIRNGRNFFYSHFGSLESDNLLNKLRYFAVGLEVDFIILDHISIVVSGQESSREGERKDIDILMTRLRSLIEETGVGVIAISHLKQIDGKSHEEGGRVTLAHLRGSGSLKQLSDNVIALERDQQGDDPTVSQARLLKCREFGETGPAGLLRYDRETGRLLPDGSAKIDFAKTTPASNDF
jgi:twinkle protein